MAPNIIYCAPIPFNIVFHNANKGKMRINVLDLSRFCCALGRERANRDQAASSFSASTLYLYTPSAHPFPIRRWMRHFASFDTGARASQPTPPIFFPLACSQRIFLSKSLLFSSPFPPPSLPILSTPSVPPFLRSFVSLRLKGSFDVVVTGKNDARCFVARTLARGSFGR